MKTFTVAVFLMFLFYTFLTVTPADWATERYCRRTSQELAPRAYDQGFKFRDRDAEAEIASQCQDKMKGMKLDEFLVKYLGLKKF